MSLHPRALMPLLLKRLSRWPVTVLTGARQTGKTTLVRELLPGTGAMPVVYLCLDDPDERLRLAADPVRRLEHPGSLVVLDEIQKQPALLDAVKFLADRKGGHRFLLLGSSQILLMQKVRESLAGRATLLDLWPLGLAERGPGSEVPGSGLDQIWKSGLEGVEALSRQSPPVEVARRWTGLFEDTVAWGAFPGLEALPDDDRRVWLRDFRRTYLERDLADLGRVADLDQFAAAQKLLAARTGQLLSYSDVARDLDVAVNTVKRYVRFLEISYQLTLLPSWQPSPATEVVKSPKVYWTDPGLARLLSERHSLLDGPLFETAVADELIRWCSWQAEPPALHFFRTRAGREIDFILKGPQSLIGIEAKAGRRVSRADARALVEFVSASGSSSTGESGGPTHRLGLVVTSGREVTALAPGVFAVPFWRLFGPAG